MAVRGTIADRFLPEYDVVEHHEILVRATPEATYQALLDVDMRGSRVLRTLFLLRGMSRAALTLEGMERAGFVRLLEEPPRHLVIGLVGKFWTPTGCLRRFEPAEFRDFAEPGYAKAAWSFTVTQKSPDTLRLETETRVLALDPVSRRRFRRYWRLVGPFSAWTRREILRIVADSAESAAA